MSKKTMSGVFNTKKIGFKESLTCLALTALLSACGGSSESPAASTAPAPQPSEELTTTQPVNVNKLTADALPNYLNRNIQDGRILLRTARPFLQW